MGGAMPKTPHLEEVLQPKRRDLAFLWIAMIATLGFYLLVAYFVIRSADLPPPRVSWKVPLVVALSVISAAIAALSLFLSRRVASKQKIEGLSEPGRVAADCRALTEEERRIVGLYSLYVTSRIVSWALNETIREVT